MGDVAAALGAGRAGDRARRAGPATAGGVVASGLAGPRRLRYGSPRDLLIGITIVRADGTVARSGGKVVKNVAGYDLGKLLAGSAGTLGADHRGDVPAAPAARRAGVRDRRVRCPPGRVRRGGGGGQLAAGRLGGGTEPARAGRADPDQRPPRGVRGRGRGAREADGGSARPGRDVAAPPPLVARRARRRRRDPDPRLVLGVGAADGAGRRRGGGARSGLSAPVAGSAGAGVLYVSRRLRVAAGTWPGSCGRCAPRLPGRAAGLTCWPRRARYGRRWPTCGGMAGAVPGLGLMRAVKDQFDPGYRMAPGRFPDAM